jgi:outer membrane protein W
MKYKLAILTIFTVILSNNISLSQPSATVQMIVGYSLPLPDLKGNFGQTRTTFTGNGNPDTNTYFMKSGINYGIFVKLPVTKKSNFNIKGGIAFNVFSNSTEYNDTSGSVSINLTQSILGITLGGEYIFATKKSKFNPFVDAELAVNFFSGKYTEEYVSTTNTLNLNSTVRLGIHVGAGIDYVLHNNIGAVIGAKYGIANLIGKSYEANTQKNYNLNDKSYTENGAAYPSKNITYLQFYGGVSFYFGR